MIFVFLLSLVCNAEHAAHKSDKFTHMARRTRYEYMKDLATTQISTQNIDPPQKFGRPMINSVFYYTQFLIS